MARTVFSPKKCYVDPNSAYSNKLRGPVIATFYTGIKEASATSTPEVKKAQSLYHIKFTPLVDDYQIDIDSRVEISW